MRRKGCIFEYEDDRNNDLLRAFRTLMADHTVTEIDDIWNRMASMPSSRFWVSDERAYIVMLRMMAGDTLPYMSRTKRSMFHEIYRRFTEARKENPDVSARQLCAQIVCQKAPSFYLTPSSIRIIIYKIRRNWYGSRRKGNMTT